MPTTAAIPDATSVPIPVMQRISQRWHSWGLPLLAKELIELGVRPRTYHIRLIYAATLLVISFCVLVANVPSANLSTVGALGVGRPVLQTVTLLQELGLYIVLPILACSTLTTEKERQSLDLLLITKLGPWTIIFEKFLSQLIAAVNLLLLSLPLIAFCYSLGGITPERLTIALLELLLTAVRLTAIGVFCSAMLSTTSQALLATYGLVVVTCFLEQGVQFLLLIVVRWIQPQIADLFPNDLLSVLTYDPGIFALLRSSLILGHSVDIAFPVRLLLGCLPSLVGSFGFLVLARWFLAPPVHSWCWWISQYRGRRNRSSGHQREIHDVPEDEPIAWREGPRGNRTRWWIKWVCLTSVPIFVVLLGLSWRYQREELRAVTTFINAVIWIAITVRLCSHSATLLSPERVHQTLDLLCCSPMTGEQIMRQKMQSVWRLIYLCRVALITCLVFRTLAFPSLPYILLSVITIGLYPPLIAWTGLTCGLKAKSGANAILQSLLTLGGWCFIPFVVMFLMAFLSGGGGDGTGFAFVASFSPLTLLGLVEILPYSSSGRMDSEFIQILSVVTFMTLIVHGLRFAFLWDWAFREANVALRGAPEKLTFDLPTYRVD